jgi:RNA polymerase sigma factor (sigma-70 family)
LEDHIGYGYLGLVEAKARLQDDKCYQHIPYLKKCIKYAMYDGINLSVGRKKWVRNAPPVRTVSIDDVSAEQIMQTNSGTYQKEENLVFEYDFKTFFDSLSEIEKRILLYNCLPGTLRQLARQLGISYNQLVYIRKMLRQKLREWRRFYEPNDGYVIT